MTKNKQSTPASEEYIKKTIKFRRSDVFVEHHTQYNHIPCRGHKISSKSETRPDQNMSVIEIMKRFASGRPVYGNNSTPIYEEEGVMNMPDITKMELTDRMNAIEEAANTLHELAVKLQDTREKESQEKLKKQWLTELEKLKSEQKVLETAPTGPNQGEKGTTGTIS